MSESLHVEKPFLDQLATLGWTIMDQGQGFIPSDPVARLRGSFRDWLLLEVFRTSVRSLNLGGSPGSWLDVTPCCQSLA
jgi:type I restriction enzyme R subunit